MKSMDNPGLKRALEAAADLILSETDALTRADQAIGDGDHGIGMERGFTAVKAGLAASGETVPATLEFVGKTLMLKVGGSSGAIFGTMFLSGAKALSAQDENAGGGALHSPDSLDAEGLARFLEAGLEGVQKRGNAKPGDKTMVDALAPAAAEARAQAAESLDTALKAAAEAARAGMERTRDMVATLGRAKTLGERALGHPDPGAMSMTFLLQGMVAGLTP
jgi:dihydroxyacetone kinase-like protein